MALRRSGNPTERFEGGTVSKKKPTKWPDSPILTKVKALVYRTHNERRAVLQEIIAKHNLGDLPGIRHTISAQALSGTCYAVRDLCAVLVLSGKPLDLELVEDLRVLNAVAGLAYKVDSVNLQRAEDNVASSSKWGRASAEAELEATRVSAVDAAMRGLQ